MSMIAKLRKEKWGFITDEKELDAVIAENPDIEIIIRCGVGRYCVSVKYVRAYMKQIVLKGDYIRDISIRPEKN